MSDAFLELTSEGWVASNTLDQGTENCTDTNTGTGQTDGGCTSTVEFSGHNDGGGCGLGNNTTGLHGTADHARAQVGTGAVEQETIAHERLSSRADDGALDGSWVYDEKLSVNQGVFNGSSLCEVDMNRVLCRAPMRATAPVILLAAYISKKLRGDAFGGSLK